MRLHDVNTFLRHSFTRVENHKRLKPKDINASEALQMLAAWSKWLVTLEVATLGALGLMLKVTESQPANLSWASLVLAFPCAMCLLASIFCATVLLMALPGCVHRLPPAHDEDIYQMHDGFGNPIVPWITLQNTLFLVGMVFFILFVAIRILNLGT